jgi:hypothetical protein
MKKIQPISLIRKGKEHTQMSFLPNFVNPQWIRTGRVMSSTSMAFYFVPRDNGTARTTAQPTHGVAPSGPPSIVSLNVANRGGGLNLKLAVAPPQLMVFSRIRPGGASSGQRS